MRGLGALLAACLLAIAAAWLAGAAAASGAADAHSCPGVAGGVCGRTCQLHLCQALADFYRLSNNLTDPWDDERGWETTATVPCQQLVGAGGRPRAVYCDWFGITCCTPAGIAAGNCSAVNAIGGLALPINNMNASMANTSWLGAIQRLHGCGLTVLNIEANNLVDNIIDAWGSLTNLTVLNLGEGSPHFSRQLHARVLARCWALVIGATSTTDACAAVPMYLQATAGLLARCRPRCGSCASCVASTLPTTGSTARCLLGWASFVSCSHCTWAASLVTMLALMVSWGCAAPSLQRLAPWNSCGSSTWRPTH